MAESDGQLSLTSPPPAPDALALLAPGGGWIGADRRFHELLAAGAPGDYPGSFPGGLPDLLAWLRPRLVAGQLPSAADLGRAIEDGTAIEIAFEIGSEIEAAVEAQKRGRLHLSLRSLDGHAGWVISVCNRGEHHRLQQRAHQAEKMAAIGRLVGGIAHDFNNLLTVISGYSDFSLSLLEKLDASLLLSQKGHSLELRDGLDEITKASARASRLTRQLLAYSRQQVISPEVLDLNAELQELERMLDRLLGGEVTLHVESLIQPATVRADRGQIHQVIMNLVINARDAMPRGGTITLRTEAFTVDERYAAQFDYPVETGDKVMLRVRDQGAGIDPSHLPHIFEPFFTTKDLGSGTGLGLSTVYGIIKQSHGYVWVDSELGRGTEFRICLPLERGDVDRRREQATAIAPASGQHILVVDDDEAVREVIVRLLQGEGYRTSAAASAEQALALLEASEPFELAIIDLMLAEMDGLELSRRILAKRPDLPVLFISGYDPDAYNRRGVMPEGTSFLAKPLDAASLRARVARLLGR